MARDVLAQVVGNLKPFLSVAGRGPFVGSGTSFGLRSVVSMTKTRSPSSALLPFFGEGLPY